MKTLRYILYFIFIGLVIWLFNSCANPVSPTGGPKDAAPPELLNATPPQSSLNFSTNKVELTFDEYVEIKDLNKQMIISPPMEEAPEFKIKGKTVSIEFKSPLKDSTTYNLYLGDAIVDITEGNPIKNFSYVFSTGNILDSLSLKGKLLNAFDLKPVENISIMLYLDNNDTIPYDSLPYLVKPYYLSRTDENGLFEFHNLIDKPFKIFALEDGNSNLIFDQTTERIAFINEQVIPYYIEVPVIDSIVSDSLAVIDSVLQTSNRKEVIEFDLENNTINIDTINAELQDLETLSDSLLADSTISKEPPPIQMYLFEENDSIQRFLKATMEHKNKLLFVFRQPTINYHIAPLNLTKDSTWFIEEANKTKDTIAYWITKLIQDSITFKISDDTIILDTVDVALVKKSKNKRLLKKDDEKPKGLAFKFSKSTPDLNKALHVKFSFPIKDYSLDNSLLVEGEDTLKPIFEFADSIKLSGNFVHKWKEETSYKLFIPDSSFTDRLNSSNDTIQHNFRTKALADYGNLYVNVTINNEESHIIQLLIGEKVHTEIHVHESQKLSFEYLNPGDYFLKVIFDKNKNGIWDPGDYIYNLQPEQVDFFTKTVTVRANWDVEEEWILEND